MHGPEVRALRPWLGTGRERDKLSTAGLTVGDPGAVGQVGSPGWARHVLPAPCSLCRWHVAPAVAQGVQAEDAQGLGCTAVGGQQEPRHCRLSSSIFYPFLFF